MVCFDSFEKLSVFMVFPFQTDMEKPPPHKPRKRKNPAPLPLMIILGLLQRRHNRPMGPTLKKVVLMQRMIVVMQQMVVMPQMTFVSLGAVSMTSLSRRH